ncbi:MAG: PadR family transcriptional regulator [Micromonosporaceae bacterium]
MSDGPLGLASSLRRGALEFCVLALLSTKARYGVELVRELATAEALTTSEGTLYPLLSRLRRTGWVSTTWQESPAGPPRRYYSLTRAGREALALFRREWVAFRDAVDRIVGTEGR